MKKNKIIYWIATGIIALMMVFSAYSYLAKPEMTFEGDALDNAFTEHPYFSKEGASGGGGVGGGGCGCN